MLGTIVLLFRKFYRFQFYPIVRMVAPLLTPMVCTYFTLFYCFVSFGYGTLFVALTKNDALSSIALMAYSRVCYMLGLALPWELPAVLIPLWLWTSIAYSLGPPNHNGLSDLSDFEWVLD